MKKITYKYAKRLLRENPNRYRMESFTCDGARWPEGNHFVVIRDCGRMRMIHAAVNHKQEMDLRVEVNDLAELH